MCNHWINDYRAIIIDFLCLTNKGVHDAMTYSSSALEPKCYYHPGLFSYADTRSLLRTETIWSLPHSLKSVMTAVMLLRRCGFYAKIGDPVWSNLCVKIFICRPKYFIYFWQLSVTFIIFITKTVIILFLFSLPSP